jgi:hypothetical protein
MVIDGPVLKYLTALGNLITWQKLEYDIVRATFVLILTNFNEPADHSEI